MNRRYVGIGTEIIVSNEQETSVCYDIHTAYEQYGVLSGAVMQLAVVGYYEDGGFDVINVLATIEEAKDNDE